MGGVVVLIGGKSDVQLVRDSKMLDVFESVGLSVPVHIISCHRNVTELEQFCRETTADVLIAAAGLAAALPGAVTAATAMRKVVIGVPLDEFGVDTCIRLPPGVPTLTAGVGKAGLFNAAMAACQVIALTDATVRERLDAYLTEAARAPQFDVAVAHA